MSTDSPFISVIMPVYNGEKLLTTAIESVLKQNQPSLELIIVDDGSTDNSKEIAKSFENQIKYLYQENQGAGAARNHGLENARGDIIGFLDADDLWPADILSRQLHHLEDDQVELVMGHTQCVREIETEDGKIGFEKLTDPLLVPLMGSYMLRKSVFQKVGYFNPELRMSEDVDWFLQVRECGVKIVTMPEVTLLYRRHQDNITNIKTWQDLNLLEVIKKSLNRRREQGKGVAGSLPDLSSFQSVPKREPPHKPER